MSRDDLILEHLDLAERVSRKFRRLFPSLADDLHSAALVGLVRAVDTFDPSRGNPLERHAFFTMRSEIIDEIRRSFPKGHNGRNGHGYGVSAGDGATASYTDSTDPHAGPVGWELEFQDWVEWLARKAVPNRNAEIVRAYHAEASCRKDMRAAGARIGVSQSRASQVLIEAHERLRRDGRIA